MEVTRLDYDGYVPPPMPVSTGGEVVVAETQSAPSVGSQKNYEGVDLLQRAVREINTSIEPYSRHLEIRHHEATNRRIVTVYDSDTNEKVREIPPESVLEAHANMLEMVGLFVNTRG
ncbi:MAG: flagellar protein FlaG [Defluviitaleaceae bacterium]|nr:flagellar protein FlaG [Defluviitaleaceae bacterium]